MTNYYAEPTPSDDKPLEKTSKIALTSTYARKHDHVYKCAIIRQEAKAYIMPFVIADE